MRQNPTYSAALQNGEAVYGSEVTACFYKGDKFPPEEDFAEKRFADYIDDMGGDWQKGHILAKSLGGEAIPENLIPMKKTINDSTFKSVENTVHTLIDNLADIEKKLDVNPLHIEYNIQSNQNDLMTVKGFTFPREVIYSIKLMNESTEIDSIRLRVHLTLMGIKLTSKLKGTIRVDGLEE